MPELNKVLTKTKCKSQQRKPETKIINTPHGRHRRDTRAEHHEEATGGWRMRERTDEDCRVNTDWIHLHINRWGEWGGEKDRWGNEVGKPREGKTHRGHWERRDTQGHDIKTNQNTTTRHRITAASWSKLDKRKYWDTYGRISITLTLKYSVCVL